MNSESFDSVQETRHERGLKPLVWCQTCNRRPARGTIDLHGAIFEVCDICVKDREWKYL